jgi:hypothetical protein
MTLTSMTLLPSSAQLGYPRLSCFAIRRRRLRVRAPSDVTQQQGGGGEVPRGGPTDTGHHRVDLALDPFASILPDRALSLEFGAVMLALQLCQGVNVYGFPSFAILKVQLRNQKLARCLPKYTTAQQPHHHHSRVTSSIFLPALVRFPTSPTWLITTVISPPSYSAPTFFRDTFSPYGSYR